MLRSFLLLLLFIGAGTRFAHSQQVFEKGYLIDDQKNRLEGFIQMEKWTSSGSLSYRLDLRGETRVRPMSEIVEFGVNGSFRILHQPVLTSAFSNPGGKPPVWQEARVFLWTLVDGPASLFLYETENQSIFFFQIKEGPIEQLLIADKDSTSGSRAQQILFERVNCLDSARQHFARVIQSRPALVKHFLDENTCLGSPAKYFPRGYPEPAPSPVLPIQTTQPEASTFVKPTFNYVSVELNPLLNQILDFDGDDEGTGNQFTVQFANNNRRTGKGVAMAFSYQRLNTKETSTQLDRETTQRSLTFRVGYERKRSIAKRWILLHGYDFLVGLTKEAVSTNQSGFQVDIESNGTKWGLGPRGGLMFGLSDQVFLGTEATFYLTFLKEKQTLTGQSDSEQKSSEFLLALPVSLFLTVRLNN